MTQHRPSTNGVGSALRLTQPTAYRNEGLLIRPSGTQDQVRGRLFSQGEKGKPRGPQQRKLLATLHTRPFMP